jgi:hypothetical protein
MIVICNGAFKSGSSWLMNIVCQLTTPAAIAQEWRNPEWVNPSIHPDKLAGFLSAHTGRSAAYVSKNHLGKPEHRALLLDNGAGDVHVMNITRDIRDVIVSAYYHAARVDGYVGSFGNYLHDKGIDVAKWVCSYNQLWSSPHERLHVASYERLILDPDKEIEAMSRFLKLDHGMEKIREIRAKTSFDALKSRSGHPHFRKGIIGDWKNHLTEADAAMLRGILPSWAFLSEAD